MFSPHALPTFTFFFDISCAGHAIMFFKTEDDPDVLTRVSLVPPYTASWRAWALFNLHGEL